MPTPVRKLAFYEIGKGKYSELMQTNFEKAAALAIKRNQPITVTSSITVFPPARDAEGLQEHFADLSFNVGLKVPSITSRKYTAELDRNGKILQDGDSITDLLQESLNLGLEPSDIEKKRHSATAE